MPFTNRYRFIDPSIDPDLLPWYPIERINDGCILFCRDFPLPRSTSQYFKVDEKTIEGVMNLQHPQILSVHEVILDKFDEKVYLIVKTIGPFSTLKTMLVAYQRDQVGIPETMIYKVLAELANGLHYCFHTILPRIRDITSLVPLLYLTPDNIILQGDGACMLDFTRLECLFDSSPSSLSSFPFMNYFSPETLVKGRRTITEASMVWSLGCIAYELATLHTFTINPTVDTIEQRLLTLGSDFQIPGYGRELATLIQETLAFNPSHRPTLSSLLKLDSLRGYILQRPSPSLMNSLGTTTDLRPNRDRPTSSMPYVQQWRISFNSTEHDPALARYTSPDPLPMIPFFEGDEPLLPSRSVIDSLRYIHSSPDSVLHSFNTYLKNHNHSHTSHNQEVTDSTCVPLKEQHEIPVDSYIQPLDPPEYLHDTDQTIGMSLGSNPEDPAYPIRTFGEQPTELVENTGLRPAMPMAQAQAQPLPENPMGRVVGNTVTAIVSKATSEIYRQPNNSSSLYGRRPSKDGTTSPKENTTTLSVLARHTSPSSPGMSNDGITSSKLLADSYFPNYPENIAPMDLNVGAATKLDEESLQLTEMDGMTPLMKAVIANDMNLVLKYAPTQARITDHKGLTALMYAAYFDRCDAVKVLLDKESKMQDDTGMTALMYAAYRGHPNTTVQLYPHEARLVTTRGITALMFASNGGHLGAVRTLARKEARMLDAHGNSALIYAARVGCAPIIAELLPYEAGLRNGDEWTGLMIAARNGHVDAIPLLLPRERGFQSQAGISALMLAAANDQDGACQLLLSSEKGLRDMHEETALMKAAALGSFAAAAVLVQEEAGLRRPDGKTALMCAASAGHTDIVRLLVEKEARLQRIDGGTALMYATEQGHDECVRVLVEYEAGIQRSNGECALMIATCRGYLECVKTLVPWEGAVRMADGTSVLDIAVAMGREPVLEVLEGAL
ncbi:Kinase [Giardia muris]|uniref:Kinase n=1 Tax=Giardia muris TaxID=5742 RepID=A0A4Z1TCR3_GIAMU|nr:Kinase [Giardia muris]|eukprot:TNJ30291.1 Kinase [Giardia muris]